MRDEYRIDPYPTPKEPLPIRYKVVRKDGNRLISSAVPRKIAREYIPGQWTQGYEGTPLLVFGDLQRAKDFVRNDYNLEIFEIWECECRGKRSLPPGHIGTLNVDIKGFWDDRNRYLGPLLTSMWPPSTEAWDEVRLTRRVHPEEERPPEDLPILVLGDAFEDLWIECGRLRVSAEAGCLIGKVDRKSSYLGGAGNVAANLRALTNQYGKPFRKVILYSGPGRPRKTRLLFNGSQVARYDENDSVLPISEDQVREIKNREWAAIVVADYDKGSVSPDVWRAVAEAECPKFVHTKNPVGSCLRGQHDVLFFCNQAEYVKKPLGFYHSPYDQVRCVVTNGPRGAIYEDPEGPMYSTPSLAKHIVSVCGAGDSFLAGWVALAVAEPHAPVPALLRFASAAAAVAVGKPRTAVATLEEVEKFLKETKNA